ncbi:MAG TPA: phytanoyl-CoA dioxygenase family protein [Chthonomonadaceae bacterium]|nr:phytanoyl-CoA dioxygenase family protein [Chthonomonadaceae bacterium]
MMSDTTTTAAQTPRPGLTLAQRFHLEVYGYVLLKNVFRPEEVERMKAALYRMRDDPDLEAKRVYTHKHGNHYQLFGHLVEYDPALLDYAADPRLVPLAEDLVGGAVRLEESEAIINRRDPEAVLPEGRRVVPVGFHTGTRHGWGTYYEQNRFHCIFVKTLTYLTDVGPGDGGTAVIPGSHRMSWPQQEMIRAAMEDERLIHQIEAPAGSTLLFPESLIHSTTAITTDKERVILVSGYTPTMMREWMGNEISPEFVETLPEAIRPLISGSDNWRWRRNYPN